MRRELSTKMHTLSADDDTGIVKAIVSVYDVVNSQNSVIRYGAFANSIAKRLPMVVTEHNWDSPNAVTTTAKELAPNDPLLPDDLKEFGGLYVEGQYFKDIAGSWESYQKIKHGIYREYSIAFEIVQSTMIDGDVEEITEAEWFEWCPVFMGANDRTVTISTHGLNIHDDTHAVTKELDRNVARWEHRWNMRSHAGRTISAENMAELNSTKEMLQSAVDRIQAVIEKASPVKNSDEARARIRIIKTQTERMTR